MKKLFTTALVLLGALVLTTLAIDASDTLRGTTGTMLARVLPGESPICPAGMTHSQASLSFSCVDTYEVAPGEDCSIENPTSQYETEANISQKNCLPVPDAERLPWRYVSREQARTLCAKAGKRLPTASEWYEFSLGTNKNNCVVNNGGVVTGLKQSQCVSAIGVVGSVGNVWEWVVDDVVDGVTGGKLLPISGRVESVDSAGLATVTGTTSNEFLPGYFWSDPYGEYGIIRGGFYGSNKDAGLYTAHTHTKTNFVGEAVGFRCVR